MTDLGGNVRSVLIIGGGVPGWLAATYLNRLLRGAGCTVRVVESIKLETGGVGEATLPALVPLLRGLGVDETKLLQQCSATYRLGTRFVNWVREGQEFWHPHGLAGGT